MKRILIIHPTGNINYNSQLTGIVEILCENGFEIDICSPKKSFCQNSPCERASFILRNNFTDNVKAKMINRNYPRFIINSFVKLDYQFLSRSKKKYDLIIGLNRRGIIEAQIVAKLLNVPYGLISYEIYFESETEKGFKRLEREACRNIRFAICQDNVRSKLLSSENSIPLEKIINIPLAGRYHERGKRTRYLHDKFHIPYDKKIALFAGSFADWAMIDELLASSPLWPDDWVLVLHNRYCLANEIINRFSYIKRAHVYISNELIPSPKDMRKLLYAIDLGIAFYKPTFNSRSSGNNLKYIGLSSGKISSYLQHGVPVLINEIGEMSDLVKEHGLGFVINDMKSIPNLLVGFDLDSYTERCFSFFDEYLASNRRVAPLLQKINQVCGSRN